MQKILKDGGERRHLPAMPGIESWGWGLPIGQPKPYKARQVYRPQIQKRAMDSNPIK